MSRIGLWGVTLLFLGALQAGCRTARVERVSRGHSPSAVALAYGRAIVGGGGEPSIRPLLSRRAMEGGSRETRDRALRRFRAALPQPHGTPEVSVAALGEIRGTRGTVLVLSRFSDAGMYLLLGIPVVMETDWRVEPEPTAFPAKEFRRGGLGEIEGKRAADYILWSTGKKDRDRGPSQAEKNPAAAADYLVARCLLDMGEAESALPLLKRALASDPDLPGLREALRRAAEEAKTGGERGMEPVPPERAALMTCIRTGRRYFREGAYRRAVEEFEKALALDGQNAEAIQYMKRAKEKIKGNR